MVGRGGRGRRGRGRSRGFGFLEKLGVSVHIRIRSWRNIGRSSNACGMSTIPPEFRSL